MLHVIKHNSALRNQGMYANDAHDAQSAERALNS